METQYLQSSKRAQFTRDRACRNDRTNVEHGVLSSMISGNKNGDRSCTIGMGPINLRTHYGQPSAVRRYVYKYGAQ